MPCNRIFSQWLPWAALLMVALSGTILTAQDTAQTKSQSKNSTAQKEEKPSGPTKRLLIHRRYLRIPVCEDSSSQDLSVTADDGKEVKRLDVKLAGADQDVSSWIELDVSPWIGGELILQLANDNQTSPQKAFAHIRQSNTATSTTAPAKRDAAEPTTTAPKNKISFAFQIQPILSEKCYACHGADAHNEDSELRLSDRDSATESGAIVEGNADDSELIARIIADDSDIVMPPPESHKTPLTKAEVKLIRDWINEGAEYEKHWSFTSLKAPAVPSAIEHADAAKAERGELRSFIRNDIDAFVLRKLTQNGLSPNPDADPARSVRRLAFDLTGLPPALDLVESFVADPSDANWSDTVDQMLESHHYGEQWARHWLDSVRYGDTHGIHIDNSRTIWPYRDWVVDAFNQNMPFDEFTVDQIAGDMLPNSSVKQKVASGYNRCLPTTSEGGSIDKELLVNYANDQTATTFAVWQGLTAGCAACHDHKFDPLSQKEYYQLTAFFRNSTMAAKDGNQPSPPPTLRLPTPTQQQKISNLEKRRLDIEKSLADKRKQWDQSAQKGLSDQQTFEAVASFGEPQPHAIKPIPVWSFGPLEIASLADSADVKLGSGPFGDSLVVKKGKSQVTDAVLPKPNPELGSQFSFGGHIRASENATGSVWTQMHGGQAARGWEMQVAKQNFRVRVVADARHRAIDVDVQADVTDNKWHHIFVTYDGYRPDRQLHVYVDGLPRNYRYGKTSNRTIPPTSSWETDARLVFGDRDSKDSGSSKNAIKSGEVLIADFHYFDVAVPTRTAIESALIYSSLAKAPEPFETVEKSDAQETKNEEPSAETKPVKLTKQQKEAKRKADLPKTRAKDLNQLRRKMLTSTLQRNKFPQFFNAKMELAAVSAKLTNLRFDSPITLVMQEKQDSIPSAHILDRGDYASELEKVTADVPSMLPPLTPTAPRNRLGLAGWLVSPENPLTARVTVNRYWHYLFGHGIVETTEDFGITGSQPSHPELLNWLADDFVQNDWNIKRLLRQIVTSSTYRQSQRFTKEKLRLDPENRLLSRGPRTRLDGEQLRDMALLNAGLLTDQLGGPPVRPYQPEKIWEDVSMAQSDTRFYRQSFGDQLYRRSLYTFWKRTAAPPNMTILNAPARDTFCVRRERTNTPLQAFVMWNDPQFVEAARKVAEGTLAQGLEFDQAIDRISSLFVSRRFDSAERKLLRNTLDAALKDFSAHPDRAESLLEVGTSSYDPDLDSANLAAWTLVTSQIMNLDETLTR